MARVFLVDDDASVRKALGRLLRAAGYEVETFESAQDYLVHAAVTTAPTCLILDVQMPGIDGLELQRALKGTPLDVPVVIITGHGDDTARARALAAGAVDVLFKPLSEDTLIAAIEQALDRCERHG